MAPLGHMKRRWLPPGRQAPAEAGAEACLAVSHPITPRVIAKS